MKFILPILFLLISCGQKDSGEERVKQFLKPDAISTANSVSNTSEITCPFCDFTAMEKLPTEYCLIRYDCKNCKKNILPKDGDCCVFCSYGTHKCPSMQETDQSQ